MSRSQEIAAAVALESLGYDIEVKGERRAGRRRSARASPADGELEIGDVDRARRTASR